MNEEFSKRFIFCFLIYLYGNKVQRWKGEREKGREGIMIRFRLLEDSRREITEKNRNESH